MLRAPHIRICILAVSVLLPSCVFDSDGEYFNNLPRPDPTTISAILNAVDLSNYDPGDTVDVFGTTGFNFSIKGNHGDIESANISLSSDNGDTWKLTTTAKNNSFTISKDDLSNGIFVLKLDLIAKTGSGSLADVVGKEKFNISLKWIIKVDLSPPPQPVATLDIVNGYLTLHWTSYTKPNFQSYTVKRKLSNGKTHSFEINDKQITDWRDEDYVGGYASAIEYSVSIVSETGTATSVPVSRIDPFDVSFSFNTFDSTVTCKWTPTEFYGAFKEYQFGIGNGAVTVLTDINASTLNYKLTMVRFGSELRTGLRVQSRSEDIPAIWKWGICKLGTPLTFAPTGKIIFNPYLNSLVAVDGDKRLLELNEQLEPVREVAVLKGKHWKMPYPGNYIYSYSDHYDNKNIYSLKLEDNSEGSYDYFYLRSQNSNHTVASNGLICLDYDRPPVISANIPPLYITHVFGHRDTNENSVYSERSNSVKLSAIISEDGKFIWANNNRVFRISADTSELVGSFTGTGTFIGFRQDESNEMMFRDEDKINFYDTNTLTFIRSINSPGSGYYWGGSYDVQTKNMIWTRNSPSAKVYIVNIETGATKAILVSSNVSTDEFYMVNELMVCNGSYIKID